MTISHLPLLFIAAFLVSSLIIFLLVRSPLAFHFADAPDHRKVHQQIVPRLGGLGLVISFLLIQLVYRYVVQEPLPQLPLLYFFAVMFLSIFLIVGGTLDDVRPVTYKLKFALQFFLASVIVVFFDIRFEQIHFFDFTITLGFGGTILSILWLVGVMNALNIIDGIDGLAASVSIIGFITVAILANARHALDIVALSILMSGITAGFLIHNFSQKKKTFLGDTGSLFLGTILGLLCIMVTKLPNNQFSFFVPLLIVGYPIFDTSVAMFRRFTRRIKRQKLRVRRRFLNMFEADNEHLHHRLVQWGLTHLQATGMLSLVAATMGSVAIIISRTELFLRIGILSYLIAALFLILNRLNYIGGRHWLTFPRGKTVRPELVGVIEPEEVFFYSLKTYDQHKVEFLNIPVTMTHKLINQLSAIIVHNTDKRKFEDDWKTALRAAEIHDCPVFMLAGQQQSELVNPHERNFKSVVLIKKPVRVPELMEVIENKIGRSYRSGHFFADPQIAIHESVKENANA